MDFDLSEEQQLFKDNVDRLMDEQYGFEQRKGFAIQPDGWSRTMWSHYAALGFLGLPFAQSEGGTGGGAIEIMLVMEAFGRGLVLEPFLATVVLGGGFLRFGASDAVRRELLPRIAAGDLLLAFACGEAQARYDLFDVATTAGRCENGWLLTGKKAIVLHGDCADFLIVSARIDGQRRSRDGIGLFLIDVQAPGVLRHGYMTQDGLRAADIELTGVHVMPENVIGQPGRAYPLIERVVDQAVAALAAEAVGAMDALLALTVEYMKTRVQFGQPIGRFQALQHRAAEMLIAVELARSMAMYGTVMAEETDPNLRHRALAATKYEIGKLARFVGQQGIQLHGGIGMTEEYKAGHYFRRLAMIERLFGDTDHALKTLANAGGLIGD